MNDMFEKRVKAAAVAGWWTLLIAVGFITLQWIIYLVVMSTRPARFLWMWGPEVDWAFVRIVWFCVIPPVRVPLLSTTHDISCPISPFPGQ
jgi:hypothetical protein